MAKSRKEQVELDNLIVNPENYRFDPVKDEPKALSTMMNNLGSEVANLARDIAKNGLNPLRTPLAVSKKGKYIVLDGNRRTTALKLLDNPELIPEAYPLRQVFRSIKEQGYVPPKKVEFVVYNEKDLNEADRWVYIEHNGQNKGVGTVTWGSKEKARFSARHNPGVADKALQFTDFLESKKIDTQGIDQTTLNRILSDPLIRQRLGVDYVKGTLSIDDESAALPAIKKVVSKMQDPKFKVRDVYSKDDREKWIEQVLPAKPKKPTPGPTPPKPGKPKPPRTFPGLIDPSESISDKLPEKIRDIHDELVKINVGRTPHATAALTRIYMELLSKEYVIDCLGFQQQGDKLVDSTGGGDFSELKSKLGAIQTHGPTPKDIKGSLRILIAKDLVTTQFNQVMHSVIFKATEPDLRGLWTNLKPVMYYIGNEIAKTKK